MMIRHFFLATLMSLVNVLSPDACSQEKSRSSQPRRLETGPFPTVEEELRRVDRGEYSSLMRYLLDPRSTTELGLSEKQRELIRRLDELSRGVLRMWLQRGSEQSQPKTGRLTAHDSMIESQIIAHAESLGRLGILTDKQNSLIRKGIALEVKDPAGPTIVVRRPRPRRAVRGALTQEEAEELKSAIRAEARVLIGNNDYASFFFMSLAQRGVARAIEASDEQTRLISRLNQLTREIVQLQLLRGLDAATPPPDLSERLSERGLQERERIVAHAETLVSLGILTPKQLEVAKRDIWRELGSRALLDSELAARIRLSPQQREEIAARLARTRRIQEELDATIGALRARTFEDGGRIALEADREIRRRTDEADSLVWDVLDESQLARLEAILHSKVNPPRPRR